MSARSPKVRANRQRQRPRPVIRLSWVTHRGLFDLQLRQATAKPAEAKVKAKAKAEPKAKVGGFMYFIFIPRFLLILILHERNLCEGIKSRKIQYHSKKLQAKH